MELTLPAVYRTSVNWLAGLAYVKEVQALW